MKNCVMINLKKNEILIKISENAEQREIVECLRKKLPELKKLYKDEKTPIRVIGKVLKNKEMDQIQEMVTNAIDVQIDFDTPKSLGLSSIRRTFKEKLLFLKRNFIEVHYVLDKSLKLKEA